MGWTQQAFNRVQAIASALPGVSERVSHGEPCFFVGNTRAFCYYHGNHNDDGRLSLSCPAPPGVQEEFVSAEPCRFFKPPMSASGTFLGWLGVFLDTTGEDSVDWDEELWATEVTIAEDAITREHAAWHAARTARSLPGGLA